MHAYVTIKFSTRICVASCRKKLGRLDCEEGVGGIMQMEQANISVNWSWRCALECVMQEKHPAWAEH